jgi:hypothetical protein
MNATTTSADAPPHLPSARLRLRAALTHLALSAVFAAFASILVFTFWYPTPFREISGGRELFTLLVVVDVVVGPLITLVVFDSRKRRVELVRDMTIVVLLQAAALAYGIYSMASARPVVVALETDRLRVVRALDVSDADFSRAPAGFESLSWTGPRFVATRKPETPEEQLESIERGLAGQDLGMRPEYWLPPSSISASFARAALPLQQLRQKQPQHASLIDDAVRSVELPVQRLGYLPLLARSSSWSALIDRSTGEVLTYVPVDGF